MTDIVLERKLMDRALLEQVLSAENLMNPKFIQAPAPPAV